jgi:hypothetical protein
MPRIALLDVDTLRAFQSWRDFDVTKGGMTFKANVRNVHVKSFWNHMGPQTVV